jgi:putative transposase
VCHRLSKSRAAYYKQMKKQKQQKLQDYLIRELVMEKRKIMPRLGGKKLYRLVGRSMREHLIYMGRDKFFTWLRERDLLVKPKKRFTKTTHSHHRFRVHKNLIKDIEITHPDQIWVSDITYLKLQKGFCYLALMTDAYSRKIVGYDISQSLELNGCLRALQMACAQRRMNQTIHHSDRGIQYCSNQYTERLSENNIQISMAEAGNCYENAMAERMNGILKSEFNLDCVFKDLNEAQKATRQAIETYNAQRPHMSIGMKMPDELYAA